MGTNHGVRLMEYMQQQEKGEKMGSLSVHGRRPSGPVLDRVCYLIKASPTLATGG